jgi:hypothetical protein
LQWMEFLKMKFCRFFSQKMKKYLAE